MNRFTRGIRRLILGGFVVGGFFYAVNYAITRDGRARLEVARPLVEQLMKLRYEGCKLPDILEEVTSPESIEGLIYLKRGCEFTLVVQYGGIDIYACRRWDSETSKWYSSTENGCSVRYQPQNKTRHGSADQADR